MEGTVFTEGDHVVDSFAHSFGPRQRSHDAPVADDLRPTQSPYIQSEQHDQRVLMQQG